MFILSLQFSKREINPLSDLLSFYGFFEASRSLFEYYI